ncbi:hypothetical protein GTQ34_08170 [Muricauda sp. JGD-17]|uniref:Adhesin domain-containing protein n=1 Tax=Flagellimonas ochracea TaxID=2696472 RepID=A0A964TBM6_9FLAO|nr:hypothetical protein [Allomuricauda ochracea]NAY91890.1 hypothetical protein [Allomuricauda ochracea]
MRALFFLLGFFLLGSLNGQKLVEKGLIGPHIESIHINAHFCYQIEVNTHQGDEIQVLANIEGEYTKDLLVGLTESGNTVFVDAGFQPNFINPNDKLSAHKVISIALQVTLPEYKEVHIYGTNSNTKVSGNFRKLEIKIADGRCVLQDVIEHVVVTTQKADIFLNIPKGDVTAKSLYGEIHEEFIPTGDYRYILNTVEGNIHLKKTK